MFWKFYLIGLIPVAFSFVLLFTTDTSGAGNMLGLSLFILLLVSILLSWPVTMVLFWTFKLLLLKTNWKFGKKEFFISLFATGTMLLMLDIAYVDFDLRSPLLQFMAKHSKGESYIACGCGCCGYEPASQCVFSKEELQAAKDRDIEKSKADTCKIVGCQVGIEYKYCGF